MEWVPKVSGEWQLLGGRWDGVSGFNVGFLRTYGFRGAFFVFVLFIAKPVRGGSTLVLTRSEKCRNVG